MKKSETYDFTEPIRQSYVAILMIVYKYYSVIVRQLLPLIVLFVIGRNKSATWTDYIVYGVVGIALLSMIVAIIAYFRFYFHVENDELIVKQGILNKKKTSIPFDRIQTINLEQNLVHQFFKVVRVEVDTAGTDKSEFRFDALKMDMAEQLRSKILARKSKLKKVDSETQAHEEGEVEFSQEILKVEIPQLIKIGLTENHIKSGWIIFAFAFWVYESLTDVGVDVDGYRDEFSMSPTVSFILFLIILYIGVSIVISLVRTILLYFELKFIRIGNGFRVTSGLFTRKNVAALDNKIQMVSFSDNLLMKLLGYKNLLLKQASSVEITSKKSIKIPGCLQQQIDGVTNTLYGNRNQEGIRYFKVDQRYFIRSAAYIILFSMIIIIPGYLLDQLWMVVGGLIIMSYLILITYLNYRKTKYGFNDKMVIVKGGTFGDRTTMFPLYKLQSAALRQNFYQRRKDLATVVLYTASGGTSIPYIDKSVAESVVNYMLYKVESDSRKWM
ncbi:MAG: PH domain-containing protein [Saprospiraceae bacterium]|nr:PH domain-containing protein [Saprospiraceae bacterium]